MKKSTYAAPARMLCVLAAVLLLAVLCAVPAFAETHAHAIASDTGELIVRVGGQLQLRLQAEEGTEMTGQSALWLSSNPAVAGVDSSGVASGKSVGTATISCLSMDGTETYAECELQVVQGVEGLRISADKMELLLDSASSEGILQCEILPENAFFDKITWHSEDESIAAVDADGKVRAAAPGTVIITAEANDPGFEGTASCEVTVRQAVTGIEITAEQNAVYLNESTALAAAVTPENADNQTIVWESQNPDVASVDSYGTVTGRGVGKAVITCTAQDGSGVSGRYTVEVRAHVSGLQISDSSAVLMIGAGTEAAEKQLTVSVSPEDAFDKAVIWQSSDETVAAVDENGKVTAIGVGTAEITAASHDAAYTYSVRCNVTVQQAVTDITLDRADAVIYTGEYAGLAASVLPEDAANRSLIWESSDPEVATVDSYGSVSARSVGRATITCTAADGSGIKAACEVEVRAHVREISLSDRAVTLMLGTDEEKAVYVLGAEVTPENAFDKGVVWESSDEQIVTVDADGRLQAQGIGTASVIASAADPAYTSTVRCDVTVRQAVGSIRLSSVDEILYTGESVRLEAEVGPEEASDKSLVWESSDPEIASVDSYGTVSARSVGRATITCTAADGSGVKAACKVEIRAHVKNLTLSDSAVTLMLGAGEEKAVYTLTAEVSPEDAFEKGVIWTSSDESVAVVDESGTVTAVGIGTAEITAGSRDETYTYSARCTVTVRQAVGLINLSSHDEVLYTGNSLRLEAAVEPEDASDKSLVWESSDPEIATVDSYGTVSARTVGSVTITCTAADGSGVKDVCRVETRANVRSISTSERSVVLLLGAGREAAEKQITVEFQPEDAFDKTLVWSSSDEAVVKVDENGLLQAAGVGSATVTVTPNDAAYAYPATISVEVHQAVMQIHLDKTDEIVYTGNSFRIEPAVSPEYASNTRVVWTSSDPEIASVDSYGTVSGRNVGKAVITCTAEDGSGVKAECAVEVRANVRSLSLSDSSVQLVLGGPAEAAEKQLTTVCTPEDAFDQSVTWTSTDDSIVTVDENGFLQAVGSGSATITATANDSAYSAYATCSVTVGDAVKSIRFGSVSSRVQKGSSFTIQTTLTPERPLNATLAWSSSNERVLTVDQYGRVYAAGVGKATITCRATDGSGVSRDTEITVYQPVTGISAARNTYVIFEGKSITAKVTVSPSDATDKSIRWSSDSSCVTVDANGNVTGVRTGTATITAAAKDGSGRSCTFRVVVEPKNPVEVTGMSRGIYQGNRLTIKFKNNCRSTTITNIYFDMKMYTNNGVVISDSSYYATRSISVGPGGTHELSGDFSGVASTASFEIVVTAVDLADGTTWYIPWGDQRTSTWGFD